MSVESSKVFEILTSNPLEVTPFHFKVFSSQNYLDLTKCFLLTEFRITKENQNGQVIPIVDADNVAPIQMIGQTFIQDMHISINGREVFNANSLMAYKTYFSHELSFPLGAKESHLTAAGYYKETGGTLEGGDGFNTRKSLFARSRTAQFIAKIDADLFNQPLYLINHCEVDITIYPHGTNFVLIAPNDALTRFRFEFLGCKLYVKKLDLTAGLSLDLANKLDQRPARYAVRKSLMKALYIGEGRYEFNANIFMDQIPRRVIMGLVSNNDYVGNIQRSPFNFQHFNVRDINIVANGRNYPQVPFELDYTNGNYVRAFNDMNEACGLANSRQSSGITYLQYARTHCIYVHNLTNSGEDQSGLFDLIRKGTTAVSIKFSQPVPQGGIVLIVMGEADSLMNLDKNRQISTDLTI